MFSSRNITPLRNFQKEKKNWEYYNPPESSTPVECCLDSSLHGLKYIGQKNRHCFERMFWICAFTASVVCAGFLIHQLLETYTDSPIVTVFDPVETELKKIAFPAVTICNINKIKSSKREQFKKKTFNPENETMYLKSLAVMADLKNVCQLEIIMNRMVTDISFPWSFWYDNFTTDLKNRRDEFEKYINPSKTLKDGTQKCEEMLVFCMWQDEVQNCSQLFRPIMTDYGYCCTFNTIPDALLMKNFNDRREDDNYADMKEWEETEITSEDFIVGDVADEVSDQKFPQRQEYPSRWSGLSVMLEPNLTEYSCSSTDSEGFVIGLNGPLDFPRMKEDVVLVQPATETFLKLHPQITISDKSIKKFPVNKRHCVFDDEEELTFLEHYTKYTASNCLSECVSKKTAEICHCVRYYMTRNSSVPLCRPEKYDCATNVQRNATEGEGHCSDCYPTCTDIQYQAEVTALDIREHHLHKLFSAYPNRKRSKDSAIVHFYFGQPTYQSRLRKEMYTIIDLISSAGGLLGLCMGFSMLSLLEILYYYTFRLCCKYRLKYVETLMSKKLESNISIYYEELAQIRLSKQWPRQEVKILHGKDPIFKLVQSRNWSRNT